MTLKSTLPYPSSPPPQPPLPANTIDSRSSEPDWAAEPQALPPLHGAGSVTGRSTFHEAENPWAEFPAKDLRSDRPLPTALKAGPSRLSENAVAQSGGQSLANVPNVLRAGHSQEDTPRSSLDSGRSKDFWEDSDDGQEEGPGRPKKGHIALPEGDHDEDPWANVDSGEGNSLGSKRIPVGSGLSPAQTSPEPPASTGLASNNPFKRPSEQHLTDGGIHRLDWGRDVTPSSKGRQPDRGIALPPTDYSGGLMTESSRKTDMPTYNGPFASKSSETHTSRPVMPQAPPPPIPVEPQSPFSEQAPLIPVSPHHGSIENPWASNLNLGAPTPSPIPFSPSQKQVSTYNDDLLDRGQQNGLVSLQDELETLPNAAQPTGTVALEESSLLDDDEDRPPIPIRPVQRAGTGYFEPPIGPPPPISARPPISTIVPSDEEVARMTEQRNETYQIKHFNWFDHSSRKLRRSSMLTQNKNGPCPLLALVNALILGATDESQAALDEALRTREQVSLGLIIETLMDELLSKGYDAVGDVMPDVDELNYFLMRLRTGMNANPRFVPPSAPPPNLMDADESMLSVPRYRRVQQKLGTFEPTTDMKLYGAFQVPLVHGWLPDPGSVAAKAFARSAQTYEDAQALQFGEEELEYKLSRQGLSEAEENMWQDINSIKNFLNTFPTQLTPQGLEAVQESISSGSFAIMFRNDHFSTIYKHPESGQLFTLITDAGYADRDEIIWESLVDISGKHGEFFSGDFMPVSHNNTTELTTHAAARRTSQLLSVNNPPSVAPMSPQEQQEQHDADFAMALQLQEEEEQRQRAERNRRRSGGNPTPNNLPQQRRLQSGNIPISLRSNQQQQQQQHAPPEVRPTIPPRNSHAPNPGVNRPSDALADDVPPAYEEAAKGRPYIPPLGSPLHPSSEPSSMNSNTQLTGTVSSISQHSASGSHFDPPAHSPGPNALRRDPRRRTSAYNETQQFYQSSGRLHPQSAIAGPGGRNARMSREDRDCIVM